MDKILKSENIKKILKIIYETVQLVTITYSFKFLKGERSKNGKRIEEVKR